MMVIGIMSFLLAVSVLSYAAAWLIDDALRRLARPTRWVWLVGLAAPFLLLVVPALLPGGVEAVGDAASPALVFELPGLVVGDVAGPTFGVWLSMGLGALWLLGSVGLAGLLIRTHRRLLRERGGWTTSTVSGREVYLSADRGPAVAGVVHPWIVLPRWALSLPGRELDLVVLHEEEHVRARDTLLLAGGVLLVVLTPWNPMSWLKLRGLKTAMEVDCDRRVLRRAPDPEAYGGSLISVAARARGLSLGLAAFTERRRSLKRRILAMTPKHSRWTPVYAALLVLVAVLLGVQACYVESPILIINGDEDDVAAIEELVDPSVVVPEAPEEVSFEAREVEPEPEPLPEPERQDLSAEPTFTPFTAAPSITNRTRVVEAMQREYPPLLREAGIGGTVVLWFFIDETGSVGDVRIQESSGHQALDEAALRVADVYRFSPGMNREKPVPVWVQFPITFQAGDGEGEQPH